MQWGRFIRAVCVVSVLAVLLPVVAGAQGAPASAAGSNFSIATVPPLYPTFNGAISDYAVRCTGTFATRVTTTGSEFVYVGGRKFGGPVSLYEPLVAGQGLQVRRGSQSYYIRCLPSDFPNYTSSVTGQPQASGYLATIGTYAVAFDPHGVPVWWYLDTNFLGPLDATFFDSSTIGWADGAVQFQLRGLDGTLKATVGGGSVPLDFHDLQRLPNGDYLGIMDVTRNCPTDPSQCVDLSSWGLSSQAQIIDNVIVELNSANQIVWSWSTADHINVATENANWRDQFPDVIHMNSIYSDGSGGVIFSARHLDAVYRIDMATGAITWKLGGTPTPQSLTVVGDQYPVVFSGQHFARLLPDGTLTVQDNGTRTNRPVRALRFAIDTNAKTATIVERVSDSRSIPAFCCGSAAKLPTGDWVTSWGGNPYVTELNPQGVPQITISFTAPLFSYRVAPLGASIGALRQGMDAMVPPLVVTGDNSPPTTNVLLPSDGASLLGGQFLDAAATDNAVATNVEFRLTGGSFNNSLIATATPTIYGWIAGWDTTTVPDGAYTLQSVAYDGAGNSASSPPITFTVAN